VNADIEIEVITALYSLVPSGGKTGTMHIAWSTLHLPFRFKFLAVWIIPILSSCMALSQGSLRNMGSALSQVGPTYMTITLYTFTSEILSRICRKWLHLWLPSHGGPTTHPGTEFSMGKAGCTRYECISRHNFTVLLQLKGYSFICKLMNCFMENSY